MNRNDFFSKASSHLLLFSGMMVVFSIMASSLAHADTKTLSTTTRMEVRSIEEKRVAKSKEETYKKQMLALEKHYRNLAIKAEQNGGNSAPLFAAAKHFKTASK